MVTMETVADAADGVLPEFPVTVMVQDYGPAELQSLTLWIEPGCGEQLLNWGHTTHYYHTTHYTLLSHYTLHTTHYTLLSRVTVL